MYRRAADPEESLVMPHRLASRNSRWSRPASLTLSVFALAVAACAGHETGAAAADTATPPPAVMVLRDTTFAHVIEAAGRAEPFASSVLSTKLAGTVLEVVVREGDRVVAGRTLARLDVRDLVAKQEAVSAMIAGAEAARREAEQQATRIRALFADSAATRAQLDAVESGLARAAAALDAARASRAEVEAVTGYGEIRAPFAGTIVERLVDPGAFAAPGVPLLRVEDASRLRIVASTSPEVVARLRRGERLPLTIEGRSETGVVEAVVPLPGTTLQSVNVIVDNRAGLHLAGSAAQVSIPAGEVSGILVPRALVHIEGDLTGVRVLSAGRVVTRWVRLGREQGELVEVLSGLTAGDSLVVPEAGSGA